jgi:hypothetical protein
VDKYSLKYYIQLAIFHVYIFQGKNKTQQNPKALQSAKTYTKNDKALGKK